MTMGFLARMSAAVLLCSTLAAQPPSSSEGGALHSKKVLTLETAQKLAATAEKFAREHEWNVCIAIVDDGGHLIYFQRMDGVQTGSVLVSMRKAETAAAFKRPSKFFEEAVAGGRTALVALPGAIPNEGGVPIMLEGQLLGAIGVSGVTAQQDGQIAQAGVDSLAGLLQAK